MSGRKASHVMENHVSLYTVISLGLTLTSGSASTARDVFTVCSIEAPPSSALKVHDTVP